MIKSFISPAIMALFYFFIIIPIGITLRFSGKDLLRLSFDKNRKSYWIERNKPMNSMKSQF